MLSRIVHISFFIFIFICQFNLSLAQTKILDTNPPGLKWYQINTPHFNIIFDRGFAKEAQRVSNIMEELYGPVSNSLNVKPKKISIILQNHNSIPNGFVTQTPRRSEFYTTPTQDYNFLGVLDWIDLLSIHEFRHVAQFDKSITKFNKGLFYVFGYTASSSMSHIAVPEWFWEGDAVAIETALTNGGRGRIPNFGMLMRTNTLERGSFNYFRQYLRSFKYNVQDHYTFGYYMTSFLRKHYGEEVISKATSGAWAWPFIPFRFSSQLKKNTGKSLIGNYNLMMIELDSLWKNQIKNREYTNSSQINFRFNNTYTDYAFPHYLSDGTIMALKSGIGDIQTFVRFDNSGKDHKLSIPGMISESGMLSVVNNVIAWNEFEFDPRWRSITYSVIKTYNVHTGKLRRVTKKSRYGSAALSPDAKIIATVETSHDSRYNIIIIDSKSGNELERIPNHENYFFSNPNWSPDGKSIVAVKQSKGKKTLWIYDLENSSESDLWEMNSENVGFPVFYRDYILYNSSYDGMDNIYAINRSSEERFRVSSGKFGSYNPVISPDESKILYNDFSKDGLNVAEMPLDTNSWISIGKVERNPESYFLSITEQEGNTNILDSVKQNDYPVKRYHLGKHIFNPYGWGPSILSTNLDFMIGIQSRDIMSTSILDVGYEFNANERTGQWIANFSYQGLFPVLNFSGYSGNRAIEDRFIFLDSNHEIQLDTLVQLTWKERGVSAGFELPFKLTRSKYIQNLDLGFRYNYSFVKDYNFTVRYPDQQADGNLYSNTYYMSYRRMMKLSKRDLYGKYGQFFYIQYENTPYGGDYLGALFGVEVRLFFPGLFKHHSLHLRSGYQKQNLDFEDKTYLFRSPIFFTRGYSYSFFNEYYNNSVNYALPLFYPDLHLGSLLNIQRVYANLFFDIGTKYLNDEYSNYKSVGVELSFDFNLLRFLQLFNMGVRYTYAMDNPMNQHQWQLLIGNFGF